MKFGVDEVTSIVIEIKGKKCFGVDCIPQLLLRDLSIRIQATMTDLLNGFAKNGLPQALKEARILPLHKKGSKIDVTNYGPISNLSPFSKLYERCLLTRLDAEVIELKLFCERWNNICLFVCAVVCYKYQLFFKTGDLFCLSSTFSNSNMTQDNQMLYKM